MTSDSPFVIRDQRRVISILVAFISLATAVFIFVAYSARQLRPAADDYCFAVDSHAGVVRGALYWFENLSGFFSSIFLGMSFVGWPLLNLPWGIGSMVPFLLVATLIGILVAGLMSLSSKRWSWTFILTVPSVAVAWWTYLWLPQGYEADGFPKWMAYTLTHWQTNNGIYVAQTVLITVACLWLWKLKEERQSLYWLFGVLGFTSGFCGPTVVVTLVVLSVAGLAFGHLFDTFSGSAPRRSLALLAAGSMLGGVVAQFAPGSLARQEKLGSSLEFSVRRIGELVQATTPEALFVWVQSFAHAGAAASILVAVSLGWVLRRIGVEISPAKATSFALLLTAGSLVSSLVARFTQLFAYEAWWHFTPTWVLSFTALFTFGLAAGSALSRFTYKWSLALASASLAVWGIAAVGAILLATTSMSERLLEWNEGPAPIGSIVSDIQNPEGFERKCWNNLMQLRQGPSRGVEPSSPGAPLGSEGGSFQRGDS